MALIASNEKIIIIRDNYTQSWAWSNISPVCGCCKILPKTNYRPGQATELGSTGPCSRREYEGGAGGGGRGTLLPGLPKTLRSHLES